MPALASDRTSWRRRADRGVAGLGLVAAVLATGAAHAETPMYYLATSGPRADAMARLTWGLLALSVLVVLVISILVIVGAIVRRHRGAVIADAPVHRPAGGLGWIYLGLALTTAALLGSVAWTMAVMAEIHAPPSEPRFTIQITGHRWWWEATYTRGDPAENFATANEIHIPVGEPVRIELTSADVIHSFWVPALSGKTDLIPGQTNITWIQADEPGVYRGRCAEYCGLQHANMALQLVAEPPGEFERWWQAQLAPAELPAKEEAHAGMAPFLTKCGICHTVRGTRAGGAVGPDLTHVMSRQTIAAGTAPNTPAYLSGWIADPQHLKPGNRMPRPELSGSELAYIRTYLQSLD